MSHLPFAACVLAVASLASFAEAPIYQFLRKAPVLRTTPYAGIYAYGTKAGQPSEHLTVYPESDSTIVFYLNLATGAPAHNNGVLLQRAVVHGQVATCTFGGGYAPPADCQLTITFQPYAPAPARGETRTASARARGPTAPIRA